MCPSGQWRWRFRPLEPACIINNAVELSSPGESGGTMVRSGDLLRWNVHERITAHLIFSIIRSPPLCTPQITFNPLRLLSLIFLMFVFHGWVEFSNTVQATFHMFYHHIHPTLQLMVFTLPLTHSNGYLQGPLKHMGLLLDLFLLILLMYSLCQYWSSFSCIGRINFFSENWLFPASRNRDLWSLLMQYVCFLQLFLENLEHEDSFIYLSAIQGNIIMLFGPIWYLDWLFFFW